MDLRLFTKTTPEMETSKTSSVLWHTQTYTNQLRHSHLPAWLGHHISASEYVSLKSHNPSPADALCVCACVFSLCWFCSDCDRSWTVASGSESQCASAKAMTQLTTKSTHRVAKQTALTRNKGGGKLVHFRLVGKIKKTKQKKLFLFPWRRHPRAQREPVPLCALPSQELVVINKATHEIIFWANILIKTVPSVTCMLYFHLVPISPTLSSKTDRQESRTQVVPSGKRTVEWEDNVFFKFDVFRPAWSVYLLSYRFSNMLVCRSWEVSPWWAWSWVIPDPYHRSIGTKDCRCPRFRSSTIIFLNYLVGSRVMAGQALYHEVSLMAQLEWCGMNYFSICSTDISHKLHESTVWKEISSSLVLCTGPGGSCYGYFPQILKYY